jgi:pimeloyl-ACP methyl ester carboxylesterase
VLPRARSIVLEDCGHVPQFEHPGRTHRLVREFLGQVR